MPVNPTPHHDQEPEYRCSHCTRLLFQSELHRYACFPCEDRAHKQITELATVYARLGSVLAPGGSRTNSGRVSASHQAPAPVNLHVLDMLGPGGIVTELQAIEDSWRVARGRTLGPRTDGVRWFATGRTKSPGHAITDHKVFITYNLQWACESYEEVASDLDVIAKLHSKVRIAFTGERRRRISVICLAEYENGSQCGAPLDIDVTAASTTCSSCGARWGRDDWLRLHESSQAVA